MIASRVLGLAARTADIVFDVEMLGQRFPSIGPWRWASIEAFSRVTSASGPFVLGWIVPERARAEAATA
jgi:hypothetical protein